MSAWQYWLVVSVILMTLEILTQGFVVACFGIGGLFGMLAAMLGVAFAWQVGGFALGSFVAFIAIRPFVLRFLYHSSDHVPTNMDALAGRTGVVTQAISTRKPGRVKVGGEDWMAVSEADQTLDEGMDVKVLRVEGAKLLVEPIDTKEDI